MSEILPGLHRIEGVFDGRWLAVYLLVGERALLVDAGFAPTAAATIVPYLVALGLAPQALAWLVVTHASGDHFGGLEILKQWAPNVQVVAHRLDAPAIANHETFLAEHLSAPAKDGVPIPMLQVDDPDFRALHGAEVLVDRAVGDGESFPLSHDWAVELHHLPGHTAGHLVVYDPRHDVLISGDALMGLGVPNLVGELVMPPHYFEVDWYRSSIAKAQAMKPEAILATHYPPICGDTVSGFLTDSAAFVEQTHELVSSMLRTADEPLDLNTLIMALRARLGIRGADYQYGLLLRAHLRQLRSQSFVHIVDTTPRRWAWVAS